MPAVFVHGVPETAAVWVPLIEALEVDDAVNLQLPGFGCSMPSGFEPTMNRCAQWLADELGAIEGPIDLVTHDWGAYLGIRVLAEQPANVRSWVTDGGQLDDTFTWHDMARLWQTPGDGEAFMDSFVDGSVEDRSGLLVGSGVPEAAAPDLAAGIDRTMADAILVLYRSATDIGREWGPFVDQIDVTSLVVSAEQDPFRAPGSHGALAQRLGAAQVSLPDQGHWWMLGDPAGAAAAISAFWAGL